MSWWQWLIILAVVGLLGVGAYDLLEDSASLRKEAEALEVSLNKLQEENKDLISRMEYFQHPENLLKELKSQFNYREIGEGLIIIVSDNSTSTNE